MRPSHGPGLYKNGRASSPVKRRGCKFVDVATEQSLTQSTVPDLAFSEMEFLQHARRDAPPLVQENRLPSNRMSSKEKERRKAESQHHEISTFFKPIKAPLEEASSNPRIERSSIHVNDEPASLLHQGGSIRRPSIALSRLSDYPEKLQSIYSRQLSSPNKYSTPHRPFSNPPGSFVHAPSVLSGRPETGITWSESQFSPGATGVSRRLRELQRSPAPAFIQKSLDRTGVFNDTGVGRPAEQSLIHSKSPSAHVQNQIPRSLSEHKTDNRKYISTSSSSLSEDETELNESSMISDSLPHLRTEGDSVVGSLREDQEPAPLDHQKRSANAAQLIIEHYIPELGWQKRVEEFPPIPGFDDHQKHVTPVARKCNSTPADVHQRPQAAKVRRPSTTLPIAGLETAQIGIFQHNDRSIGTSTSRRPALETPNNLQQALSRADVSKDRGTFQRDSSRSHGSGHATPMPRTSVYQHQMAKTQQLADQYIEAKLGEVDTLPEPQSYYASDISTSPNGLGKYEGPQNSVAGQPHSFEPFTSGSWIHRSHSHLMQSGRVSPVVELGPLYVNQIERSPEPEPEQQLVQYDGHDQFHSHIEYLDESSHYMLDFPEVNEGGGLADGIYDNGETVANDVPENIYPHTNYNVPATYEVEDIQNNPELWQDVENHDSIGEGIYEDANDLESQDLYVQLDHGVPNSWAWNDMAYETAEDVYDEAKSAATNAIQGFWRQQRQY